MKSKYCLYAIIIFGIILVIAVIGIVFIIIKSQKADDRVQDQEQDQDQQAEVSQEKNQAEYAYPHIAGYVKSGEALISEQQAMYDIVYSSDIDAEVAEELKERNPGTIILYQSLANYMFDSAVPVIEATTGEQITNAFWLKNRAGNRCGYGWTLRQAQGEPPEMWAIDITNVSNIETMAMFFSRVLEYYPQYDGLFFDVVEEISRCDSVSDTEWRQHTAVLLKAIRAKVGDKVILANAGYNYDEKSPYLEHLNGFSLESFLSGAAGFYEGMETVDIVLAKVKEPHFLIYTVYGENTVTKQPIDVKNMRLALTLSLLNDITYLAYDEKMENTGVVLWQREFSAEIGEPLGPYYEKDNACWREFENGIVISSPNADITVNFDEEMMDVTTDVRSKTFTIEKGDGRIYLEIKNYQP